MSGLIPESQSQLGRPWIPADMLTYVRNANQALKPKRALPNRRKTSPILKQEGYERYSVSGDAKRNPRLI